MANYRATPEQWANMEKYGSNIDGGYAACILELRARVEALEANAKPTSNLSQIRSSADESETLVERVGSALCEATGDQFNDWNEEARAAIREVAAWLREKEGDYSVIRWLEQEAEE